MITEALIRRKFYQFTFWINDCLSRHRIRGLLQLQVHQRVSCLTDLTQIKISRRGQKPCRGSRKWWRHRRRRVNRRNTFSAKISCKHRVWHGSELFAVSDGALFPVPSISHVRYVGPLVNGHFWLKSCEHCCWRDRSGLQKGVIS